VTLASLLFNNATDNFVIYIVSFSLDKTARRKLLSLKSVFPNVDFKFVYLDDNLVKGFKISGHGSSTNYLRLFLAELITDADEVLYLDSDIIVNASIDELLKLDIQNWAVAVVPHPESEREATLSIPAQEYFNSGVMKINLKHWRKNFITDQLVKFVRNNDSKIKYWDQDALNVVLAGNYLKLPPKWNFIDSNVTLEDVMLRDIRIIHFAGMHKPWNPHCDHALKSLYFKYRSRMKRNEIRATFVQGIFRLFQNSAKAK
jgi:UDP-glucose:(glucosyl)LPS alpha-1,3-glucosyltransferase